MSIEKSIIASRNAIKEEAENIARLEHIDQPEPKHYRAAQDVYKDLRKLSPRVMDAVITITSEEKELKNELGAELYSVFQRAWKEVKPTNSAEEMIAEIKSNPNVISSFAGKEYLLEKAINFAALFF